MNPIWCILLKFSTFHALKPIHLAVPLTKTDERFLEAVTAIHQLGHHRSDRAVSLALGLNQNYIGQVRNEQHGTSQLALSELVARFRVNANWLLVGQGPMFSDDVVTLVPAGAAPGSYNQEIAAKWSRADEPRPAVVVHEPLPEDRLARVERQQAMLMEGIAELLTKLKQA
jgi:hypothetical protein